MSGPIPSLDATELLANEEFVRGLARRLAADEAAAEDLVQDTWAAALARPPADRDRLRSWLARVLRNLAALGLRRRERRVERESACARAERQPDTALLVERVELHHRLVAAVLELEDAYRDVVLRHHFRGESLAAIARSTGTPEATVRTRLRRARLRLRNGLRDRLGDGSPAMLATLSVGMEEATRWTAEITMKKALLQAPWIVSGVVGAGLGFGGSYVLHSGGAGDRGAPAEHLVRPEDSPGATADGPALTVLAPQRRSASPAAQEPVEEPASWTDADLRRLLASRDRLDQIRAIKALSGRGTLESAEMLLDAMLTSTDPILLAMLEEALLETGEDVAPMVIEAFLSTADPGVSGRLTSLLGRLALARPSLEPQVVGLLVDVLGDPDATANRLGLVSGALIEIGIGSLDAVTELLSDPRAHPAGVAHLARVLSELDPAQADLVHQRLGEAVEATLASVGDATLTEEQRRALAEKASWLTWSASHRPREEHDSLSPVIVEGLFVATDLQQAQAMAWGVAHLAGMSDEVRQSSARQILDALAAETDPSIRQTHVWAVNELATFYHSRPIDESFHAILDMTHDALDVTDDPAVAVHLHWLLAELEGYAQEKEQGF